MANPVHALNPQTLPLTQAAHLAYKRCDTIAACSDEPGRITRTFLSPAMRQAHVVLTSWMEAAGMKVTVDDLGNLIGRYEGHSADAPVLLIGSHLDSVPNGGRYDGVLGVLLGLALVETLNAENARLPFPIEVIGFSEEEGVRYATPYLGSRALAGTFDAALLEERDADGIPMREAIRQFGLNEGGWPRVQRQPNSVLAYLEPHIEQGPVLERAAQPLGVVTAIAGQSRYRLRFHGQPGHAGTLPMPGRQDALTAAAEWILAVEASGLAAEGTVATVGMVNVFPNAGNVIPGEVVCSLDVRDARDEKRLPLLQQLLDKAQAIGNSRRVRVEAVPVGDHHAVPMDERLQSLLQQSIGGEAPLLVSGAGHDAAILAGLAPSAMLFIRHPGGISHNPAEYVAVEDVEAALGAMHRFMSLLSDSG